VLYHPLSEHLAGIIWCVLLQEPTQQGAASGDRKAYREREVIAEATVIHRAMFLFCSP
jgi:hypothetical protein